MVSMFIIVAALLEFAVVLLLKHFPRVSETRPTSEENGNDLTSPVIKGQVDIKREPKVANSNKQGWVTEKPSPQKPVYEKIDQGCFILFPSFFLLFNVFYFTVYNTF